MADRQPITEEIRDELNTLMESQFLIKKKWRLKPFWIAKAAFNHSYCAKCSSDIVKDDFYVLSAFGKFCSIECFVEYVDKYRDNPVHGSHVVEQESPFADEYREESDIEDDHQFDVEVACADMAIQVMWWLVRTYLPSKNQQT